MRQTENKKKIMKKLLAFFSSENNVRRGTTTLMTSSYDNKDSSLPHAASRLVLYTNLKKGTKSNRQRGWKEQRKQEERNKEEGGF